jgi:hypothetical protein
VCTARWRRTRRSAGWWTLPADAPRALAAIHTARAAARARVWSLAGRNSPAAGTDAIRPLVVDVDGTLVTAHSEKEQARPTFKRGFGFHPLTVFVDHGPDGTGEPLALLLRAGNAGSNTAADHLSVLRDALRQLPDVRPGTRPGRKVLVRTDAAGCTHAALAWLHAQRLSYSVGFTLPDTAGDLIDRIPTRRGPRPTTATQRSGPVPGSPSSPACSTWAAGHRGCGSSSARNAPIPARSCGSPTPTGTG